MKGKRLLKIKTIIDTYGIYNAIEFFCCGIAAFYWYCIRIKRLNHYIFDEFIQPAIV